MLIPSEEPTREENGLGERLGAAQRASHHAGFSSPHTSNPREDARCCSITGPLREDAAVVWKNQGSYLNLKHSFLHSVTFIELRIKKK